MARRARPWYRAQTGWWMVIIDGDQTVEEAGAAIFAEILATASGKPTRSEILGFGEEEFQPWLQSATL